MDHQPINAPGTRRGALSIPNEMALEDTTRHLSMDRRNIISIAPPTPELRAQDYFNPDGAIQEVAQRFAALASQARESVQLAAENPEVFKRGSVGSSQLQTPESAHSSTSEAGSQPETPESDALSVKSSFSEADAAPLLPHERVDAIQATDTNEVSNEVSHHDPSRNVPNFKSSQGYAHALWKEREIAAITACADDQAKLDGKLKYHTREHQDKKGKWHDSSDENMVYVAWLARNRDRIPAYTDTACERAEFEKRFGYPQYRDYRTSEQEQERLFGDWDFEKGFERSEGPRSGSVGPRGERELGDELPPTKFDLKKPSFRFSIPLSPKTTEEHDKGGKEEEEVSRGRSSTSVTNERRGSSSSSISKTKSKAPRMNTNGFKALVLKLQASSARASRSHVVRLGRAMKRALKENEVVMRFSDNGTAQVAVKEEVEIQLASVEEFEDEEEAFAAMSIAEEADEESLKSLTELAPMPIAEEEEVKEGEDLSQDWLRIVDSLLLP